MCDILIIKTKQEQMKTMNTKYKTLTQIILDILALLSSILD